MARRGGQAARRRVAAWEHVTWVRSDSRPGERHEIKRHVTSGALGCSCEAYRWSRGVKRCHHLDDWTGAQAAVVAVAREHYAQHPETTADVEVRIEATVYMPRRGICFGRIPVAAGGG
jgi:hypothetical protein